MSYSSEASDACGSKDGSKGNCKAVLAEEHDNQQKNTQQEPELTQNENLPAVSATLVSIPIPAGVSRKNQKSDHHSCPVEGSSMYINSREAKSYQTGGRFADGHLANSCHSNGDSAADSCEVSGHPEEASSDVQEPVTSSMMYTNSIPVYTNVTGPAINQEDQDDPYYSTPFGDGGGDAIESIDKNEDPDYEYMWIMCNLVIVVVAVVIFVVIIILLQKIIISDLPLLFIATLIMQYLATVCTTIPLLIYYLQLLSVL